MEREEERKGGGRGRERERSKEGEGTREREDTESEGERGRSDNNEERNTNTQTHTHLKLFNGTSTALKVNPLYSYLLIQRDAASHLHNRRSTTACAQKVVSEHRGDVIWPYSQTTVQWTGNETNYGEINGGEDGLSKTIVNWRSLDLN